MVNLEKQVTPDFDEESFDLFSINCKFLIFLS
jgi:hypothetical protein